MPTGFFSWSETFNLNGNSDASINMSEGMSPSAVNDGVRALMGTLRKWGTDISGAIVTTGTATAYAVASHSVYDSLAHLDGQLIAFTPHATNAATVTLNVDGLGGKPLRTAPNVELQSGTIIQGSPYLAVYSNSDAAFYLHGFYGQPLNVPLFAGMDYWHTVAPSSAFIFPAGQAISRTAFPAAFAAWGTTYGAGDGSTTFNVPDKTGRVSAMKEASATRLTSTYFGGNSANMGATGGSESQALTLAQLPTGIASSSTVGDIVQVTGGALQGFTATTGAQSFIAFSAGATIPIAAVNSTSNNTSGAAHPIVPPLIVCNYILRIV